MKIEEKSFLKTVLEGVTRFLGAEAKSELELIALEHMENLTTIRSGFFRTEDLPEISNKAAQKLIDHLNMSSGLDPVRAWQDVVRDFHENQYWGYQVLKEKPKVQKKKSEMASFLWTLFQAAVIMKFIVLYFGINAAEQDDDQYYWALGAAIFVSFASLLFFAWRKSKNYKD